jgi:hypothetical protein
VNPWFILLGAFLAILGTLWLRFRRTVTGFLSRYRQEVYGWQYTSVVRQIRTPVAGAIGMIVIGAVFLAVGIVAAFAK